MIKIVDLKKSFGPKEVLRGVNLTIEEGKTTCILGGSGSGKSTLIKCLIRLEDATSGEIIVDGKDITKIHSEIKLAGDRIDGTATHLLCIQTVLYRCDDILILVFSGCDIGICHSGGRRIHVALTSGAAGRCHTHSAAI